MLRRIILLAIATFTMIGCAARTTTNIDRLVAQSVATQPTTASESLEVLSRTRKSIDIALRTTDENIACAEVNAYKARVIIYRADDVPLIHFDLEQGSLEMTGNRIDVAIQGQGFLVIKQPTPGGEGIAYTRNGALFRNARGDLVASFGDGYRIVPAINIPPTIPDDSISICSDGMVEYIAPGSNVKTRVGQLQLATFANAQGLVPLGGSSFASSKESGPAIMLNPGDGGAGTLQAGYLEASNVRVSAEELRRVAAEHWRDVIDRAIARAAAPH